MSLWVSGNEKRIFINTSFHCSAKCSYCYTQELNMRAIKNKNVDEIIDELYSKKYFVSGRQGTILSIGCYSECWEENNKGATIKLLTEIVKTDNYIQFATKKEILQDELEYLNRIVRFKNQIFINVSVPTISQSEQYEQGTDSIEKRLSFLQYKSKFDNLCFSLYIKPVLKGVTVKDINIYKQLFINDKDLYCIIGPMLKYTPDSMGIRIGMHDFRECPVEDEMILCEEIKKVCKVFRHSVDIINEMRGGRDEA